MRQLCSQLDALDAIAPAHIRIAVELIIDTGRRPQEISYLRWDCLDADEDGQPVLIYDNYKSHRLRRRLPIAAATAALITQQQESVRRRFPNTSTKDLALLPTQMRNPHGIKTISEDLLAQRHRTWLNGLSDLYVNVVVETDGRRANQQIPFDKARVFLYAYRHSYAQRHADAGVAPDVLKELMDHPQLSTTQGYTGWASNDGGRPSSGSRPCSSTGAAAGSDARPNSSWTASTRGGRSARSPFPTVCAPSRPTSPPAARPRLPRPFPLRGLRPLPHRRLLPARPGVLPRRPAAQPRTPGRLQCR
ncbi:tyrosine-type recombinase/integrase [Streptomyces sp. NPDC006235]|uniref:tyrosine-type recombinase/integrase n=1 Tax=Streptomyces sp. NPDC006235 TaxID=3156736 RepID=UPI0033B4B924